MKTEDSTLLIIALFLVTVIWILAVIYISRRIISIREGNVYKPTMDIDKDTKQRIEDVSKIVNLTDQEKEDIIFNLKI